MAVSMKSLGIDRLTVEEKLKLVDEIWASIDEETDALPLTDAQREEIERRLREHEADPEAALPWDEVKARLVGHLKG